MAEQRRTAQLLVELETEVKRLMIENDALKRKGVELTIKNNKLKQSLDQTTKISKAQRQQITEANTRADEAEARLLASASGPPVTPDTKDTDTVNGLKQELSQSNKRLSDYRKRLSDVQERLAVIEQVRVAIRTNLPKACCSTSCRSQFLARDSICYKSKTVEVRITKSSPQSSSMTLVFWCLTSS